MINLLKNKFIFKALTKQYHDFAICLMSYNNRCVFSEIVNPSPPKKKKLILANMPIYIYRSIDNYPFLKIHRS